MCLQQGQRFSCMTKRTTQWFHRMIGSRFLKRGTGRLLHKLRLRLLFAGLLLCHASYCFFASLPKVQKESHCEENASPPTWVQTRTRIFTAHWRSHKLRNAAIYTCISTRKVPVLRDLSNFLLTCPDVVYDTQYDILFAIPEVCISHKCLKRLGSSHYIYAEFVLKTYALVVSRNVTPPAPTPSGKIAVLLEPRIHPLYEYTVKQVMNTLGPTWALQLFVSTINENYVRNMFDVRDGGLGENILLTPLSSFGLNDMSRLGNRIQSAFSAHEVLYKSIPSEHILWFQIDVLLRAPPLFDWLKYAYVGSEFHGCEFPDCRKQTCKGICSGGNSGLSLRRKSKLLGVATRGTLPDDLWGEEYLAKSNTRAYADGNARFASDELHDNSIDNWFEDDLQISYKLLKLGQLPPGSIPPRFAISQAIPNEGLCTVSPTGLHKPWMTPWIDPRDIIWLLEAPYFALQYEKIFLAAFDGLNFTASLMPAQPPT